MDPRTAMEMTEMERRAFLRSMGLSAAFLLETAFPTSKPGLLSAEQLNLDADRLTRLRGLKHQLGSSAIATGAAELAESLLRRLKTTPEADPLRGRLTLLAGDAAELACLGAYHLSEPGPALAWSRVVEECGRQARSPDLTGWGVERQADVFQHLCGDPDRALGYLHQRAPRDGLSAPVQVRLEAVRSLAAAGSSHPFPRRERWARNAIDRAYDALTNLDVSLSELPFAVPWVGASLLSGHQGRTYVLLGYGDAAYEVLSDGLGNHPRELYGGLAGKHVTLARAAILSGDLERACAHADEALRILSERPSAQYSKELREFRAVDLAPYAGSAAVRQLDEQIGQRGSPRASATATDEAPARPKPRNRRRYIKARTRYGEWKLHSDVCPDGLRAKKRLVFSPADGRRPERLAAHPELRPGVVPCERCIGTLWT